MIDPWQAASCTLTIQDTAPFDLFGYAWKDATAGLIKS